MIQTKTVMANEQGMIEFSDDIDVLITQTYTNTCCPRESWRSRQVSITLDVSTAAGLIELLQEYIAVKEESDRRRFEK